MAGWQEGEATTQHQHEEAKERRNSAGKERKERKGTGSRQRTSDSCNSVNSRAAAGPLGTLRNNKNMWKQKTGHHEMQGRKHSYSYKHVHAEREREENTAT